MSNDYRPGGGLDLSVDVGSTQAMIAFDTHVLCHRIDDFDRIEHIKTMARQKCVGASGNCIG